jgi:hypothetical protein
MAMGCRPFLVMCVASLLLLAVAAASCVLWLSLVCIGSFGVFAIAIDIYQAALIVDGVPSDWRGRVNALPLSIKLQVILLSTLGCAFIGWLWPGAWGVTYGSWTCGIVSLALLALCLRKLSQARRNAAAVVPSERPVEPAPVKRRVPARLLACIAVIAGLCAAYSLLRARHKEAARVIQGG